MYVLSKVDIFMSFEHMKFLGPTIVNHVGSNRILVGWSLAIFHLVFIMCVVVLLACLAESAGGVGIKRRLGADSAKDAQPSSSAGPLGPVEARGPGGIRRRLLDESAGGAQASSSSTGSGGPREARGGGGVRHRLQRAFDMAA